MTATHPARCARPKSEALPLRVLRASFPGFPAHRAACEHGWRPDTRGSSAVGTVTVLHADRTDCHHDGDPAGRARRGFDGDPSGSGPQRRDPPDPESGRWRPADQSDAFGDWFATTWPAPQGPAPRRAARPGPVRLAAVAVAAGPDRDGGGGDDGRGAVAVADPHLRERCRPGPAPPSPSLCLRPPAARQATACHPAAPPGTTPAEPVPVTPGASADAPRPSPLPTAPAAVPACHYRAGTWRFRRDRAAAHRAQHPAPTACHQHPTVACHHPATIACHQPAACLSPPHQRRPPRPRRRPPTWRTVPPEPVTSTPPPPVTSTPPPPVTTSSTPPAT